MADRVEWYSASELFAQIYVGDDSDLRIGEGATAVNPIYEREQSATAQPLRVRGVRPRAMAGSVVVDFRRRDDGHVTGDEAPALTEDFSLVSRAV